MAADVLTVLWKEWRELLSQRGSARSTLLSLLIPVAVMGVLIPWQAGRTWLSSPLTAVTWAWLPLVLVATVIAESFAGERERHTLETLLATRLSDRAILFGKVAAATLYGWLAAVLVAVLGLVTANLAAGGDGPRFYAPAVLGGGLVLSLLVALLAAAGGCLVSLRAGTVRQAQQVMGLISIVFVIPVVVVPLLPGAVRQGLFALLTSTSPGRLAAGAVLLLALTDAALVALALVRFRRARLMLD